MRKLTTTIFFAALLLAPTLGRADVPVEAETFAGGHFFNSANKLGRGGEATGGTAFENTGTFGLRFGFVIIPRLELEAELGLSPTVTRDHAQKKPDGCEGASCRELGATVLAIGWRGNVLFHILTGRIRPYVLGGGGGFTSSSSNTHPDGASQDTKGELHLGAGVKVDIGCRWGLRAEGRVQFEPATGHGSYVTEDGELTLALYGLFGKGIEARCAPPKPIVVTVPPIAVVLPDSDGDGIPDGQDKCPTAKGIPENKGCPDIDSDKDGVVDRLDKCPQMAGPAANSGCPDTDQDGDGVIDRLDKCPTEVGVAQFDGCPPPDTDHDGIPDSADKCPNEPETKNGFQDEDGCPDELPPAVKQFSGKVEGISFANGKAVVLPSSFKTLDAAAKVLKDYPQLKLEIQGHTDDVGDHDKNVELSQKRAEAVVKYLVDQGVAKERLTAKGYGPDRPIGDNKTKKGKAENRRVEFQLVQ